MFRNRKFLDWLSDAWPHKVLIPLLIAAPVVTGCGGSDGGDPSVDTAVVDIEVEDRSIALRADSRVSILFNFDLSLLSNDDATIYIVVHIPAELDYRRDTSRFIESAGSKRINPDEIECDSGDSYVVYALGNELVGGAANPEGDARAEVQLTVRAVGESDSRVSIQARAELADPEVRCGERFESEQELLLSIES